MCETKLLLCSRFSNPRVLSAYMNGQRVGTREVKTICLTPAQGGLFARWQMGGLVEATPLIWTSSVFPLMSIKGAGQAGWQGANMLLAIGVPRLAFLLRPEK